MAQATHYVIAKSLPVRRKKKSLAPMSLSGSIDRVVEH